MITLCIIHWKKICRNIVNSKVIWKLLEKGLKGSGQTFSHGGNRKYNTEFPVSHCKRLPKEVRGFHFSKFSYAFWKTYNKNIIQSKLLNGLQWRCIYKITIAQSFKITIQRNFMGYPHYGIKA